MDNKPQALRAGFLEASVTSSDYAMKWLRARLVEALLKDERGLHAANQKWVIGLVKLERFDILEILFEGGFGIANTGDDDLSLAMSGMIKDSEAYEQHPKVLSFAMTHMPLANALMLYNCITKRAKVATTNLIDPLVVRLANDANVVNDDSAFNKPHIPSHLLTKLTNIPAWRKYIAVDLSVYEFIAFLTEHPEHMRAFEPHYLERFNGKMFWPYINHLLETGQDLSANDTHLFAFAKGKGQHAAGDRSVWPEQILNFSKLLRLKQGVSIPQKELWNEMFISAWSDIDRVSRLDMPGTDLVLKIAQCKNLTWKDLPTKPVQELLNGNLWVNGKSNDDIKKQRQMEVLFRLRTPCPKVMDVLKLIRSADHPLVACCGYAVAEHINENPAFKDQWVHWTLAHRYFKLFIQLIEEGICLNLNGRERKFIVAKMPAELFQTILPRLDSALLAKLFEQAITLKADVKASYIAPYMHKITEEQVKNILVGEMTNTLRIIQERMPATTPVLSRLASLYSPEKGLTEVLKKLQ